MERKRMMGILMFCFLLMVTFSSNTLAEKPDSITLAIISDMTGPYAAVAGPMNPGAVDACAYVNEELGGIDGVKIKLVLRDMEGKVALGLQQYAGLIEMKPKPLFFVVFQTPTAEALRKKIVADDVLGFFPASIDCLFPQGNTVSYWSLYPSFGALFMKWVKNNWEEERNPRVAIITWDTAYGRAILTKEVFDYAKKIGVDIVAKELFGVRNVDLTTQMVRIRAKNPDWLLTNSLGSGPLAIMKAAKDLGMKVRLGNSLGSDWATIRLNPSIFQDCITMTQCVSYDNKDHPGVKKVLSYLKKYNRSEKEQVALYITGWQYLLMVHKVVSDAVAKVGWDNLNNDALRKELFSLTDWEPLDGLVKVTYTKKLPATPWAKIYKVKGEKLVPPGSKWGGKGEWVKCPDMTPAKYR